MQDTQNAPNGADTPFPGVYTVKDANGTPWHVPTLGWAAQRRLTREGVYSTILKADETNGGGVKVFDDSVTGAISQILHEAFRRNYPSITVDAVEEMIDFGNIMHVLYAITGGAMGKEAPAQEATTIVARPSDAAESKV